MKFAEITSLARVAVGNGRLLCMRSISDSYGRGGLARH